MLKAIIFDMDGVLVDSEPLHYKANVNMLRKKGIELDYDYYKQFIGSTNPHMWKTMKDYFSLVESVEQLVLESGIEKRRLIDETGFLPIKYVYEFVKHLYDEGYKLAVASSSSIEYINEVTTYFGIKKYFTELVSGINVKNPKPAPDVFLETARKLGLKSEECLVVEDSQNGVLAAKSANMSCVGFVNPNSGEQCLDKADYLVLGFEELDKEFVEMVYAFSHRIPRVILETKRIRVREMEVSDYNKLIEVYETLKTEKFVEQLYEKEAEENYIKDYIESMYRFYGYGVWILEDKKTGNIIGRMGYNNREVNDKIEVEFGYLIDKNYQNQGYATEVGKELIKYGFEKLYFEKINLFIEKDNIASLKLGEKLGFKVVGNSNSNGKNYIWLENVKNKENYDMNNNK